MSGVDVVEPLRARRKKGGIRRHMMAKTPPLDLGRFVSDFGKDEKPKVKLVSKREYDMLAAKMAQR